MKRLTAKRKLKRKCIDCNTNFKKGDIYYKAREVFEEDGCVYANEYVICPKCKWKEEKHRERFEKFQKSCEHPEWAIDTRYDYIPGECVKEPRYDYCRLCGTIL
ncbi:hypothetical protein [Caloranaerobacter azorensis]|uniref:Uncharacterized protein n=1 Tax=Caloranaerobacter azorensis TaxID=116090 RepID=A0A6P1Y9Q6_9FIRM|nr:hypothetical protein [Caloranaerobacter azorensis]QIB26080.1 hypothetical protein G3A45_01395 [Caloranaerobacter azorensis]